MNVIGALEAEINSTAVAWRHQIRKIGSESRCKRVKMSSCKRNIVPYHILHRIDDHPAPALFIITLCQTHPALCFEAPAANFQSLRTVHPVGTWAALPNMAAFRMA